MSTPCKAWFVAALAAFTLASGPADAASAGYGVNDYVVSTSKNEGWVPQYRYDVCGSVKDGATSSACVTFTDYAQTASTANLGAISGSAYAFAGPTLTWGGTVSTVESYWWDTITITSDSLAAGTLVTVNGKIDMISTVVPSAAYPTPYTRAQAQLNWGGPDAYNFVTVRSDQSYPTTGSFQAVVGGSYTIYGKYMISTGTSAHNGVDVGSVEANAHYYLWMDNPAASYATASGINYAPVPEPETAALMLAGLGLLVARSRRKLG